MQKRLAGTASSRASGIGFWQRSQSPYVPSSSLVRACSTASSWSRREAAKRLSLALLRGHLAGVGEVLVERLVRFAELSEQLLALLLE